MSTAFAGLTQAIKALLVQAPALAGGRVWRGRLRPLQIDHDSAIVVRLHQGDGVRPLTSGPSDWTTAVVIEMHARAQPEQDPEDAIDPLLQEVYQRLAAAQLGGGVMDGFAEPRVEWDFGEGDTALSCARLVIGVVHRTQPQSLAAAP